MSENTQSTQNQFECTGLTVYFIYSFALANKLSDFEYEPIEARTLFRRENRFQGYGTPESRQGIKQHLELRDQLGWKQHQAMRAEALRFKLTGKQDKSVPSCRIQIQPLVRVFRAGATCCFQVRLLPSPNSALGRETIHHILGIVQQTEREPTLTKLKIEGKPGLTTLHQLFIECVRGYITARGPKKLGVNWLDESEGYVALQAKGPKGEFQSPWVVTVVEVPAQSQTAETFCGTYADHQEPAREKDFRIRRYVTDFASILFRSVKGADFVLEPSYIDPHWAGGLSGLNNINLDARLYVTMCNRSILCICQDQGKHAASYFIPDLLDVCEMLRARWHMLTIMNRCLDKVLSDLENPKLTAEQRMRMVVGIRKWLARLLEDPELYRIAGDALANISLRLKEIFRETALRRLLLEKAEFTERIRAGIGELDWLSFRDVHTSAKAK
jgi:hypothetical protein